MQKAETVIKLSVVAIAILLAGLFAWSSAQPDPETQELIDNLEQISR